MICSTVGQFARAAPYGCPLLGLDLGDRTIGLALSDIGWCVATALATLPRRRFGDAAARLGAVIACHDVGGLVLGLPLNMNGSEGERARKTRAFAGNLARIISLPLLFADERLSTVAAERVLREAGASRKRRAKVVDQLAAVLILQSTLDRMAAAAQQVGDNRHGDNRQVADRIVTSS